MGFTMTGKRTFLLLSVAAGFLFILVFLQQPLLAGKGRITFVETAVDLKADGTAVVGYWVRWQVVSGELHGFYFQGMHKETLNAFYQYVVKAL